MPNTAESMVVELVWSLPPCDERYVVEICAGTGRAATGFISAYITADDDLVHKAPYHLERALTRLEKIDPATCPVAKALEIQQSHLEPLLPDQPADLIIGCHAFSELAL
jgi:hypothetical protein